MRPFLLVNSGSGGGATQDDIVAAAVELGLDHHVAGPGDDFGRVLSDAVALGSDLLLAAGGDGTLCAVANAAIAHDLPMVVVPAGTRNHFALDLGLDLADPVGVLRASLASGHERRVDVGTVNGTTFLNNVSLGVYAVAVGNDGYRENRVAVLLDAARQAWSDAGGSARLTLSLPGAAVVDGDEGSAAVLVANNAYSPTFAPGNRLRPRLDAGEIWVYVGGGPQREHSTLERIGHVLEKAVTQSLLRAAYGTDAVVIDSDRADVPVAVDGEARPDLVAPFTFASARGALRLLVPGDPGPTTVGVDLSW